MAGNRSHIRELAQALRDFVAKTGQFPRGTVDRKLPQNRTRTYEPIDRLSWLTELLPFLGEYGSIQKELDMNKAPRDEVNVKMGVIPVPAFLAAGYPQSSWFRHGHTATGEPQRLATTHFVGVAGVGANAAEYDLKDPRAGIFGYDRVTKPADITDGLANTIAILQVPTTFRRPWIAGGGATVVGVPEKNSIKPFVVEYDKKKGAVAIMADGSIRFIPENIPDAAFQALCIIRGAGKDAALKLTELISAPKEAVLKAKE
jgi:hypothetical protein